MSTAELAAFFDEKSADWDEQGPEPREAILKCLGLLDLGSDSRVLDIGCGTGLLEPYLLAADVADIVAIDVSPGMIAKAREKHGSDGRIAFVCGDATDFEDADGFDTAIMFNMYPHVLDKQALIAALQRLLVSGGRFAVAHGKGRDAINKHHETVPSSISQALLPATEEAKRWEGAFDVDIMIDDVDFYCVSGTLR